MRNILKLLKKKNPHSLSFTIAYLLKVTASMFILQLFLHSLLFYFFSLRSAREKISPAYFNNLTLVLFYFHFQYEIKENAKFFVWFKGLKK